MFKKIKEGSDRCHAKIEQVKSLAGSIAHLKYKQHLKNILLRELRDVAS